MGPPGSPRTGNSSRPTGSFHSLSSSNFLTYHTLSTSSPSTVISKGSVSHLYWHRGGGTMDFVRINVSLPKEIASELSKKLPPRKRSQFIAEAVRKQLKEQKAKKLAAEYEEAAAEIRIINQELEGTISEGLNWRGGDF